MNRRQFLQRGSLLVAATALLEPGELAERLAPRRLYVPGWRAERFPSQAQVADMARAVDADVIAMLRGHAEQNFEAMQQRIADMWWDHNWGTVSSDRIMDGVGTGQFLRVALP